MMQCENPDEDCYREPTNHVTWSEDITAEQSRYDVHLCDPCLAALRRGTRVSPNELETGGRWGGDCD